MKTLWGSLVLREKIKTTEAKAKEIKPGIDRLIFRAAASLSAGKKMNTARDLRKSLPQAAIKKITQSPFISRFASRKGGYTRIIKLPRRKSDGAKMAIIEFV